MSIAQRKFSNVEILAQATNGLTAVEMIDSFKPDLAFLDIEMPGLSGIEVASTTRHKPAIIFATAHDSYSVAAFKTMAIEYLLKPVRIKELSNAISKFSHLTKPPDYDLLFSKLLQKSEAAQKSRLKISCNGSDKFIPYSQIICLEANLKYTTVYTVDKKYLNEQSLSELEEILPAHDFVRIHRKHIVNFNFVEETKKWFNHQQKIILNVPFNKELLISRNYVDNLKNLY